MGILDIFKKKEEQKAPLGPSPEETPIMQALQMKERGLTNNQIIQVLQQQGYNSQQIYDALAQAEARQSIEPYTERQEPPREELPPEAPMMSTVSPALILPRLINECQAVSITRAAAAARCSSKSSGRARRLRSGTAIYSA